MDVSMTDHGRVPPTLDTLPSELRKLIVSFLAPAYLYPGSKQALKNANLAQRCLREWVPEYLFRDMALLHVMTGITSHLEYFTTHPDTADYTRYVKRVVIKVPPGLRWEVGTEGPRRSRLANTMQRFCSKFHVQSVDEMSTEQNTYCQLYHRAMVEPFIDSMRWPRLVSSAQTWGRVLNSLENLETVEVGCCERVDHPWPTVTHHFVQQHGKDVVRAEQPAYVEDDTINKGWASLLLVTIPINALTYKLTWAQTDNLTTWATVNRLLGMGYDLASRTSIVNDMRRLTLTLEGAYGTHGSRDWQGTTGTAAGVRFWQSALNKMPNLAHLTLCNHTTPDDEKLFTGSGMTNIRGNVMDWFLPGLNPPSLRTLRLQDFAFDKATVSGTFKSMKTFLNTLILDDCILVDWEEETERAALDEALLLHIQGGSWADFSQDLKNHHPGRLIKLIRPLSRIHKGNEYRLHPKSVEQITRYEGVALNMGGSYNSLVNNPPDHIDTSVANAETPSELSRSS